MAIQSVKRALDILNLFTSARPQLGISDISKLMGLPMPTVHGLVKTLRNDNFLIQNEDSKKYSLGFKIHELGSYLTTTLKINQVGGDIVNELSKKTGAISRIGLWDQNTILITYHGFPGNDSSQFPQLGPRIPGHCTALGKAVLTTFSQDRLEEYLEDKPLVKYTSNTITDKKKLYKILKKGASNGYISESEEYFAGINCIAVPVFDFSGKSVGAVSLTVKKEELQQNKIKKYCEEIKKTGMELSRRMGFIPGVIK